MLNIQSHHCLVAAIVLSGLTCLPTHDTKGAEYQTKQFDAAAPSGEVSAEVLKTLSPRGVRVVRGTSRTLCEIWLCSELPVKQLEPQGEMIYPFQPGQLLGVVRYVRKGSDFRDQDIDKGVYTMRFSSQPVDGDHEGTSHTRDFVALISADHDKSSAVLDYKSLAKESAEAADSSHPAILSLQATRGEAPIRHLEESDWWIVRLNSRIKSAAKVQETPLDLVVVGIADE